jgi:predicted MPP superfamily phosphohydrolase
MGFPRRADSSAHQADTPLTDSTLHRLLVFTDHLQDVPAWRVLAVLLLLAASLWLVTSSAALAAVYLAVVLLRWGLLRLLPVYRISYGPDHPAVLALALVYALLLHLTALLRLPLTAGLMIVLVIEVVATYATWIEPQRLGLTRESLRVRGWKSGVPPLRLLHLGDLHLEHPTPREERLQALIDRLQPDLIVFSGDFVNISYNESPQVCAEIRALIGRWHAPLGVYCVPGTSAVEPPERVAAFTDGLDNLLVLRNEWVTLDAPAGKIHVCGMVTTHDLTVDRATLAALTGTMPAVDGLRLLLTHAPDVAPEADQSGFDLYLCGHTHGGQIRLPLVGPLITSSQLGRRFAMGRRDLQRVTVYTTRGIGLEGLGAPRARLLCPPEVILWEVSGQ